MELFTVMIWLIQQVILVVVYSKKEDFIYLTKVIMNEKNFPFLLLQFVLAINVKKQKP